MDPIPAPPPPMEYQYAPAPFQDATNPMTKAEAREWVEALRSGKYRQGHGVLKDSVGDNNFEYCCLGVECEVHPEQNKAVSVGGFLASDHNTYYRLASPVQTQLVNLNDATRLSFSEIADYIEAEIIPTLGD